MCQRGQRPRQRVEEGGGLTGSDQPASCLGLDVDSSRLERLCESKVDHEQPACVPSGQADDDVIRLEVAVLSGNRSAVAPKLCQP